MTRSLSLLFSSSPTGTLGRCFTGVCAELAARGHHVTLAVPHDQQDWPATRPDEVPFDVVAWPPREAGAPAWYRFADRTVAERRPDAVVGSFSGDNHLLLAGARRRVPARLVWHHTPWDQLRLDEPGGLRWHALALRRRLVLKLATDVLVATRSSAADARARFGVPAPELTIEPYALADPGRPGVAPVPGRVAFVGRFYPSKGHDWFLRSLPPVAELVPDLEVRLTGHGPLEDRVRAGAGDRCTFLGLVDRDQLFAELASAEVAVVPSRAEGFGLVTIEAQAVGTPVVASDIPPFRESVGDAGLLVPLDDDRALAGALARVLTDGPLRARLGAAGRRRFEERFDLADRAGSLADRYEALALRRAP